jgi:hypothetical protein
MANVPPIKVEIEVDPSAAIQPFFTLDDPVLGVLDGEFGLGGLLYADVSEYVQQISVKRGKTNELERYDAGNATVTLDNTQRIFDPLGDSPFSGQLLPRRGIRVYSGGTPIFFGVVEDWNLEYNSNGDNRAIAVATDGFIRLANQELNEFTAAPQSSGARINSILSRSEVQWPLDEREIDSGAVTLQGDFIEQNTNVLNYLQLVALTELGSLFISKDGKLTFQDRLKGPSGNNFICFCDDGTNIPFTELDVVYGGEFLYNRIVIERVGGLPQTSQNTTSQDFFGISTLSRTELLMNTDLEAKTQANKLLARYQNPSYRFNSVSTNLNFINESDQEDVLSRELTDVVEIKFKPNQIGDRIEKFGKIIGITHEINPASHKVTFNLETLDFAPLVLDDVIFGVLEDYGLG